MKAWVLGKLHSGNVDEKWLKRRLGPEYEDLIGFLLPTTTSNLLLKSDLGFYLFHSKLLCCL